MKDRIISILKTVNRPGMSDIIAYLEESDFFTAPASTKYHGNFEGGLAEHSWNVYQVFKRKVSGYKLEVPNDSIAICGLLHDICKVNFYIKEQKWRKDDNGKWESYEAYGVDDKFPVGHGEKSVMILQQYIQLTVQEILLIRWHMGGFEAEESRMHMHNAMNAEPAVVMLQTADQECAYFLDIKKEEK